MAIAEDQRDAISQADIYPVLMRSRGFDNRRRSRVGTGHITTAPSDAGSVPRPPG
jgi:hypothetical protein